MGQDRYKNLGIHRSSSSSSSSCSGKASFVLLLGTVAMIVVAIPSWVADDRQSHDYVLRQIRRPLWKGSLAHQRQLGSSRCLQQKCGDMEIPYPFGLFPECAMNSFFELECTFTEGINATGEYEMRYWPFLTNIATGDANGTYNNVSDDTYLPYHYFSNSFQVLNISANALVIETTKIKAMSCGEEEGNASISLRDDGPYRLSDKNILIAVGCGSTASYSADSEYSNGGSCGPNSCNNQFYYPYCNDYDCCSMSIQPALNIYITGGGMNFHYFSICGYGSMLRPDSYRTPNPGEFGLGTYGTELFWSIPVVRGTTVSNVCKAGNGSVTESPDYACALFATCNDVTLADNDGNRTAGYYCACNSGYRGDGYKNGSTCTDIDECADASLNECSGVCTNLPGRYSCSCPSGEGGDGFKNGTGCKDIDECADESSHDCVPEADCINLLGSFNCSCKGGAHGDGHKNGTGCTGSGGPNIPLIVGSSVASAAFIVILGGLLLWWYHRRQRKNQIIDPTLSRMEILREMQVKGGANICKIFSLEELEKATSNFGDDKVVGIGGFGKIYRGTLDDGTEVAIKKAKRDIAGGRDDTKQFINEVTILSTINHHNLVKLLGCCLETMVPILVYEFISNGSLLDYIQRSKPLSNKNFDGPLLKSLDWGQRLKIAIGTATALSYLHSGTSPPIYHRDVKSANILLGKEYVAKVSDFGLSKLVPVDEEDMHMSTAVQGTPGYLDPEYIETYQMTEKSDVYSFGVVLLELLTAEKALDFSRRGPDQNLALRCRRLLKFGLFEEVVDPSLDASSNPYILEAVYNVALVAMECCEKYGDNRPTMRQVESKLRSLRDSSNLRSPSSRTSSVTNRARTGYGGYDSEAVDTWDSTSITTGEFTNSEDPVYSNKFASSSSDSVGLFRQHSRDLELVSLRQKQKYAK